MLVNGIPEHIRSDNGPEFVALNGQPACANEDLLKTHLRGDWRFRGYVVSDCGALADIFTGHHYAKTMAEAAADAFRSGTDLICGVPPQERVKVERDGLEKAVEQRLLPESTLDNALRRLFTARFRLGMFDPSEMVPWSRIAPSDNDTKRSSHAGPDPRPPASLRRGVKSEWRSSRCALFCSLLQFPWRCSPRRSRSKTR